MINKNILLSPNQTVVRKPFLLKPVGKDYLWGGSRLNDEFTKNIDLIPLAETWECSTHSDGLSSVGSGTFQGKLLIEVLKDYPDYLGLHPETFDTLPILIKIIDAKEKLSIQVHPDDEYAKRNEKDQCGKTEMWYVLDAEKDTHLIYGLHHDIDKKTLRNSILDGTIERYLRKVKVKKDEVYYIKAGTIHAIGEGALIVEIQQNSNLTYRLYDYDRTDQWGKKRELHIDKALDVADLRGRIEPVQPMRILKYRPGSASELLCRCKYFEVYRMLVNTDCCREMVDYKTDNESFHVLLCVKGCGVIFMDDGDFICFFKGDCIFFPANSVKIKLHGKAQFLDIRG